MKLANVVVLLLCLVTVDASARAEDDPWLTGYASILSFETDAGAHLAESEITTEAFASALDGATELQQTNLEYAAPTTYSQVGMTPQICGPDQTWVLVAPYVWAPAMRGTIGARGTTAQIDMSLSDLFELIEDLNGAVMAHVEVGKGDFGLIFDGLLMQLEPSQRGPAGGQIRFDISSTILESMAMVRIVNLEIDPASQSRFSIDLLGGARYYQVQNGIRINPAVGPTIQADLSKDWVDLVAGARTAVTVYPGIDGFFRADFGGFGIGTSSKLAWNLIAGMSYACDCHPGTSFAAGYRILDIDETQKSGNQRFVYDVKMQGPFAAFEFRF
jgi:hypothetical protein